MRSAHRHMTQLGELRRFQNRLAEAKIEFETAIALDRNNSGAFFHLGMLMMWLGRPQEGIPLDWKAIRLNPHHQAGAAPTYWALGHSHLLLGDVDEAIDLLRKARALNPRYWFIPLCSRARLASRAISMERRRSWPKRRSSNRNSTHWHDGESIHLRAIPNIGRSGRKRLRSVSAALASPTNDRAAEPQSGCGCISKPAGRPARRAASAGGNDGSQRLASKRQPLTLSAYARRVPRRMTATPDLLSTANGEVSDADPGFFEDCDATSLQGRFHG